MLKGRIKILAVLFNATIIFSGCDFVDDKESFGGPYTITFLDHDENVIET